MLVQISIGPDGMEQLLKHGEDRLYSWHLQITTPAISGIPKGFILLKEIELDFPTPEQMFPVVLEKFKERETEIQMEAHEEMMSIRQRRNDILMLTTAGVSET